MPNPPPGCPHDRDRERLCRTDAACRRLYPAHAARWSSPLAIAPTIMVHPGILLTLLVVALFVRHVSTPIVKASGRAPSYTLHFVILLYYANTSLLLTKPGAAVCALKRIGVGTGFAIIYSALFTKTNRITRILDSAHRSARRPPLIGPRSTLADRHRVAAGWRAAAGDDRRWRMVEHPGVRSPLTTQQEVIRKCNIRDTSVLLRWPTTCCWWSCAPCTP